MAISGQRYRRYTKLRIAFAFVAFFILSTEVTAIAVQPTRQHSVSAHYYPNYIASVLIPTTDNSTTQRAPVALSSEDTPDHVSFHSPRPTKSKTRRYILYGHNRISENILKNVQRVVSNGTSSSTTNTTTCRTPPTSFQGRKVGFYSLCNVQYCEAELVHNMEIDSLTGPVTRAEIESALGMLSNVPGVTENHQGNILSSGSFGQAAYSAGLLFEVTGDRRALDYELAMAENMLALRNDPYKGQIMWTGNRELVWPTDPVNSSELAYAGCEQGDIVGHMVSAALHILKSPCIWDKVPTFGNYKTDSYLSIFSSNDTYLTRAVALVSAGDQSVDSYLLKYFTNSHGLLVHPKSKKWSLTGDTGAPGKPMAWNRRMMILHGLLRLAAAHETLPLYDKKRTNKYDRLIRANMVDFFDNLHKRDVTVTNGESSTSNSTSTQSQTVSTYWWTYIKNENWVEESKGIHGYFDIWGTWNVWQRNAKYFGVDDAMGQRFANTFYYVVGNNVNSTNFTAQLSNVGPDNVTDNAFSGLVNGTSTYDAPAIANLWAAWSFYSYWIPDWFNVISKANIKVGFLGRSWLCLPLLWTKNARYEDNDSIWKSQFSYGTGFIPGTTFNVGLEAAIQADAFSKYFKKTDTSDSTSSDTPSVASLGLTLTTPVLSAGLATMFTALCILSQ